MKAQWVEWTPADYLNGIGGLDTGCIAAYSVLLNLIYDNGGPIVWDEDAKRTAAWRCAMRIDRFESAVASLIKRRKLIEFDGCLTNPRAELELSKRASKISKLVSNFGRDEGNRTKTQTKSTNEPIQLEAQKSGKVPIEQSRAEQSRADKTAKPSKASAVSPPRPPGRMVGKRIDRNATMAAENLTFAMHRGLSKRQAESEWFSFVRFYSSLPDSDKRSKSADWSAQWELSVLRACNRLNIPEHFSEAPPADKPLSAYPAEHWQRAIKFWEDHSGVWPENLGPAPDHPGFAGPKELLPHYVKRS